MKRTGIETMKGSNSTKNVKLVFPTDDESLEDIIMQIWNDGAEGIIYDKSDIEGFVKRLKNAKKGKAR